MEADVQKQQRLVEKRQEKAFEQAMIESPMGGIYEAQAAAEPGESVVFKTMNLLSGSGRGPGESQMIPVEYLGHRWWKF